MMTLQEFTKAVDTYLAENPVYSGWEVSVTEEEGYDRTWHITVWSPPAEDKSRTSAYTTQAAATATKQSPREIIDSLVAMLMPASDGIQ